MSKLPMESRPLRLAPMIAKLIEDRLRPLSGKKLEAAQAAILTVYRSGKQGSHDEWVTWYLGAVNDAVKEPEKVAA